MNSNDLQSRIDLLEQNLRVMQEEHDAIAVDLQKEIERLQEENRGKNLSVVLHRLNSINLDLRYRLNNNPPAEPPSSPTSNRSMNGTHSLIVILLHRLFRKTSAY